MGGGNGGKSSGIRSRILIALMGIPGPFPGAFRIGGPSRDTVKVLERVAMERGLNGVDELLVSLGKEGHEVSIDDAFAILEKECGGDAVMDVCGSLYYVPRKDNCNRLLKKYLKGVKECGNPNTTEFWLKDLKKYCGYNDDELNRLK